MLKIIATIIGYLGTASLIVSFQFKKEKNMYFIQILSGLFFTLHYLLSKNYMGMSMNVMALLRVLLMYSQKPKLTGKAAKYTLISAIILIGIFSWEDWFSLFPMIAMAVTTYYIFSGDGMKIRYAQIGCSSPCWIVYNSHVGSIPGIVTEIINILSVLIYFIRIKIKKKK